MMEEDYDAYFVSSRYRSQDYQYNYALVASQKLSSDLTYNNKSVQSAQKSDKKKTDNADKRETACPAAATPASQVHMPASGKVNSNRQSLDVNTKPMGLERYFESIRTDEYTSKNGEHMSGLEFTFRDEYKNDSVFILILAEDTVYHWLKNIIWKIKSHSNSKVVSYSLPKNEVIKGYDICTLDDSISNNIKVSEDYVIRNKLNEPVAVAFYRVMNYVSYPDIEIIAPKSQIQLRQNEKNKVMTGSLKFLRVPQTYITEDLMPKKFTDGLWDIFIWILVFGIIQILGVSVGFRIVEAFKDWKNYGWDKAKSTLTDKAEFLDIFYFLALLDGLIITLMFIVLLSVRCIEWFF